MEGNRKSVRIHCSKTGIHVEGANNIGSTSDTIVSCKRSFLRVCTSWWNDYCGRDEEDEPPKNCEVGNAKEQLARFIAFCKGQRLHSSGHADTCNPKCPCRDGGDINLCALTWAQMPYVEGRMKR